MNSLNPWVRLRGQWANRKRTNIERIMARALDDWSITFVEQKRIGPYVVDFWLSAGNTVVEVDGNIWHNNPRRKAKDDLKDKYLRTCGLRVFRFTEDAVKANADLCVRHVLRG